ncbi:hypothetical protein EGM51_06910 [Verrucomicrobia bacterium S94]|nr:hypothetical protein EGM51_06910 [Verrucomicrobia bacterium S94]
MSRIITGLSGHHRLQCRSTRHITQTATASIQKKAAFTLTEVLVALFLAVLAVTSTYKLLNYSRNVLRSSSGQLDALNRARSCLEYLRTLDFDHAYLNVGEQLLNRNGETFEYEVELYNGNSDIKQITVKAEWTSVASGKTRETELVTLLSRSLHSGSD